MDPSRPEPVSRSEDGAALAPGDAVSHFQIRRLIGEGGMGEVYEAFDERLGRRVALKSIRLRQQLGTAAKSRFLREARILSSLEHPNICRLYDYIESGRGDYLVLELIEGARLTLARRWLGRAGMLRVLAQVADVLQVAHASGVVHRDLKPDNVMVTGDGEAKVLDFGIARPIGEVDEHVEEAASNDPDATIVGRDPTHSLFRTREAHVAGTPMYMSPEQAAGSEVTVASDMFAFGLLVQEALTGRPAYEPSDDVAAQLEQAREGRPRPCVGVDRDMARLVRRLTARRPADRPTAAQARAAIERVLARPRRRLIGAISATVVILGVAGAIKYTVDLDHQRARAVEARDDAEDLIAFMVTDLYEALAPVGRLGALGGVGRKVAEYYADRPIEDLSDEDLLQFAQSLELIGQVHFARGDLGAAEQTFEDLRTRLEALLARDGTQAGAMKSLGAARFYLGYIASQRGDADAAEAHYLAYLDLAERLVATDASNPEWRLELAYAQTNLADLYLGRDRVEEGMPMLQASLETKRSLVEHDASNREWAMSLANGLTILMEAQEAEGATDEAMHAAEEALALLEGVVARHPDDTTAQYRLVVIHGHMGELLDQIGRPALAIEQYHAMCEIARALIAMEPDNVRWRREYATAHREAGWTAHRMEDFEQARLEFDASLRLFEEVTARDPTNVEYLKDLGLAVYAVMSNSMELDDHARAIEARRSLDSPWTSLDALDGEAGDSAMATFLLCDVVAGQCLSGMGRAEEARSLWEEAAGRATTLVEASDESDARDVLAQSLLLLGDVERARPLVQRLAAEAALSQRLRRLAILHGVLDGSG